MEHELKSMRVYDLKPETKGYRILADRLWPRGLRKEALEPFFRAKDIAPSNELRKWFGHDPKRFEGFKAAYLKELEANPCADEFVSMVRRMLSFSDVLLLYAAKSEPENHAAVLKEWLMGRLSDSACASAAAHAGRERMGNDPGG